MDIFSAHSNSSSDAFSTHQLWSTTTDMFLDYFPSKSIQSHAYQTEYHHKQHRSWHNCPGNEEYRANHIVKNWVICKWFRQHLVQVAWQQVQYLNHSNRQNTDIKTSLRSDLLEICLYQCRQQSASTQLITTLNLMKFCVASCYFEI